MRGREESTVMRNVHNAPEPAARWDIQVLRGVAVAWVLLYHAGVPGVQGGFLGVDIFFVVSGWLITALVQRSLLEGRFSFCEFYWRRAKRLLPAAYVTLGVTTLLTPWFLNDLEQLDFHLQLWGALAFVSNYVLMNQSGYFAGSAELKPLLHFWSLAIEEQYYLLMPALLVLVGPRWRAGVVICLTLESLGLCVYWLEVDTSAAFYLLPARAWELGLGSLGALWHGRYALPWLRVARWPALGVLALVPLFAPLGGWHPGPSALMVGLATLALLWMGQPRPQAGSWMQPLMWLGDRSYSLYLVHWPLLAFVHNAWLIDPSMPSVQHSLLAWRLAALLLAVGLAAALYRWVELPCRHSSWCPSWRHFAGVVGATALVALLPWVSQPDAQSTAQQAHLRRPNYGLHEQCDSVQAFVPRTACQTGVAPRWLVWGDSYAMHIVPGLQAPAGQSGLMQATASSCGPFLGLTPYRPASRGHQTLSLSWSADCRDFNASVLRYLAGAPQVDTVILSSSLTAYLHSPPYESLLWTAGEPAPQLRAPSVELLLQASRDTVQALRALGKRVVLIAPPPSADIDIASCLERQANKRLALGAPAGCVIQRQAYEQARALVLDYLRRAPTEAQLPVLRLDDYLCDAKRCRTEIQGVPLYRDAGHLSYDGAVVLADAMHWGSKVQQLAR
ncbi:MAG: acyltransferase [Ideonella sp. MAG2]|nr:MAG: acyltransferase [Ideonella sp. MAG2]